jgi:predicted DNA-binding transcriptional regulator YafY
VVRRREQLERLIRLLLEVQSGAWPNAAQLAERCGASRRTVHRDLATLQEAGLPIRFRRDMGGYELSVPGLRIPTLPREEWLALVAVALLPREGLEPLFAEARRGLMRLVEAQSTGNRLIAQNLCRGIEGTGVSGPDGGAAEVMAAILRALGRGSPIRVRFSDGGAQAAEATRIEGFRLVRGREGWELQGRSSLHRGSCRLRVGAIGQVEELGEGA